MTEQEWRDPTRRTLGMYLAYDNPDRASDEAFLIWFHAGADPIQVDLLTDPGPTPTP